MGVRRNGSRQELLELSVGGAHRQLTVRLLEKVPDLLGGRLFCHLDFDRSSAVKGDSTHGFLVVAIPRLGVGCRAGLTDGPPGAGQLHISKPASPCTMLTQACTESQIPQQGTYH